MASTATAPAPTGAAAAAAPSPTNGGPRPQSKPNLAAQNNSGSTNNARRSVQSPIDSGAQRRNSQHKVWAQNPQQKFQHNGNQQQPLAQNSAVTMAKPKPTDTDTGDKHLHDRTLFLLASMSGKSVTITVKSGARYSGILSGVSTSTSDLGCVLKWVKQTRAALGAQEDDSSSNGYVGTGPEKAIVFPGQDVVEFHAEKVTLGDPESSKHTQNVAPPSGFRTDTDISGGNGPTRERELHRWEPTPDEAANTGLDLDEAAPAGGAWDQFAENERLFGVKSNFDEHIYTTRVDKNHPLYHQREAQAAKIAREIEGSSAKNSHIAEERGVAFVDDSGMDEEDKYSGVQRAASAQPTQPTQVGFPPLQSSGPAKYTPPAKRAPSGHPTVPGVPHDPAIIASALARPESLPPKQPLPAKLPVPQVKLTQPDDQPKPREKPVLPDTVVKKVAAVTPSAAGKTTVPPQFEQQVSTEFKQFVMVERERYEEKKRDLIRKDKDVKLQDLMKFAREFKLHTPVPNDLIPILAKDKAKQAEIVEKARLASINAPAKVTTPTAPPAQPTATPSAAQVAHPPSNQHVDKQMYKPIHKPAQNFVPHQAFGRDKPMGVGRFGPQQQPQQLSQRLLTARGAHNAGHPVNRTPGPIADNTGGMGPKNHASGPANLLKMNARASEFKPNPTASTFTPSFGGAPTSTPSPTTSIGQANASRAASPSAFFGVKKLKTSKEDKAFVSDYFNPFKRVKTTTTASTQTTGPAPVSGKGKTPLDKQFTSPIWPTRDENKDKKYDQIFDKPEYVANSINSPQPPHMHPHQPHHQAIPPHIPHPAHGPPPHMGHPHQPHHPHHPQQHLGIPPPHFEQDQHIRHLPTPPSVIPSPHLPNATLAYGSPSTHHAQITAMYAQHGPMPPYGPGAPGAPQFGYGVHHRGGYFMQPGANGAPGNPVMVPGQPPVPYMTPFVQLPVYSPQQMHSYPGQAGPPPPAPPSTGYPSPRGAPMMMHQNSRGQAPPPPQMMQMGMPPQQAGMYGAGGAQQQSELHQNRVPQRSPIIPARRFSRGATSSPTPPPISGAISQSPHLSHLNHHVVPSNAASATAHGYLTPPGPPSSFAPPRGQTFNHGQIPGNMGNTSAVGGSHNGLISGSSYGSVSMAGSGQSHGTINQSSGSTGHSDGSSVNTVGNMMRAGGYPPHHYNNTHQQHHYPHNNRGNGQVGYGGSQHHPGGTPVAPHAQPVNQQPPPPPPPPQPQPQPAQQPHPVEGNEESK